MKRILSLSICICLILSNIPTGWAQSSSASVEAQLPNLITINTNPFGGLPYNFYIPKKNKPSVAGRITLPAAVKRTVDPQLLNWLKFNVSPTTHLPYSFYIAEKDKPMVYQHMEASGMLKGIIERVITHEGLDIYDGAVGQIVLSMIGGQENLKQAGLADDYYWKGAVGDSWNIRAGFPINNFIYDLKNPQAVSSDVDKLGQRGFIFRIIDADGNFLVKDPLDGKNTMTGFPEYDRLHWLDWKPVAGENAWVVMAALQLYHKSPRSTELQLSRELARAAMLLQSDIGGIRMAPLGTNRTLASGEAKYFTANNWWYNHISTENNISWYAAFRMLYEITGEAQYKRAMDGIERYLKFVWNKSQGFFYQGAYCKQGQWVVANENFALDVQMWSIACIGPKNLDAWFGAGSAWALWQAGRAHSGVFDKQGNILGVGYTDEHDRISVEWSAGAMTALAELSNYYKISDLDRSSEALRDKNSIRASMETLHYKISQSLAAYSYSSRRGEIPFGWNSHDPQVMSLASTGWMMFVDAGFNPFWLV